MESELPLSMVVKFEGQAMPGFAQRYVIASRIAYLCVFILFFYFRLESRCAILPVNEPG